jgi:outer membrane lipoprotein-sorting protein
MTAMRIFSSHPSLRWVVPAIAVTVIGGTSLIAASASAKDALPPESAKQLLVDLQQSKVDTFSGTIVQTSDLGLPELPGLGGGSSDTSLTSLISGTHTLQVWSSGPDKQRLAIHGTLGETDLIRNGSDLWNWSSKDNAATHTTLNADMKKPAEQSSATAVTPQDAAARALASIEPTTTVTTDPAVDVAGRPAYDLVLSPKDSGSLIGQVRIAIDGEKKVPLRVQVIASDGTSVFDTQFSMIDFGTPEAANFTFNAPPGTKVTERKAPSIDAGKAADAKTKAEKQAAQNKAQKDIKVVGSGWSSVIVTKADLSQLTSGANSSTARGKERGGDASMQQILNALPKVSGSWGSGRLLSSKAFSVVITDDGRIAAGAVAPAKLYEALS